MGAGLIDPRSQADLHAAVLALAGADRDTVNAVRRATRAVNQAAARMVAADAGTVPPAAYGQVWRSFKIRPGYTRASGADVTAGGIIASFVRGGRNLTRAYEFGSSFGDLKAGRTRPKRSPAAAGRRYERGRLHHRSQARIGMTQFPTRSAYGWYVGASTYRHLDDILTPWVDAVAGVFEQAVGGRHGQG